MRILLAHKFWYRRAGAERYVFDLKEELEAAGHEVIPFAMRHPLNEETPWARFFVSPIDFENPRGLREKWRAFCRMIYSLEAKKKFAALVREVRPDIVHINNIYHHISPSILDVCRKEKIPVAHTVHDYKIICPNYKLFCGGKQETFCKGGRYFREALHRCTKSPSNNPSSGLKIPHFGHDLPKFLQNIPDILHEFFLRPVSKSEIFPLEEGYWTGSKGSLLASLATAIEMTIHHRVLHIYERSVSAWIAPSKAVKGILIEYGLPAEKIHVIHHGISLELLNLSRVLFRRGGADSDGHRRSSRNSPSANWRRRISVPDKQIPEDTGFEILYLGRLAPEKGVDTLIRAMQNVDAYLMIAGQGEEEERLRALARSLGIENRVTFKGFVSPSERDELLASTDLVVVPSLWQEVFGYVVLEAWTHGVPVLASAIGALPELVERVSRECLFTPGEEGELSQKINALLADPQKRAAIGAKARSLVEESYTLSLEAEKTCAAYRKIGGREG